MPLNKPVLKNGIKQLLDDMKQREEDSSEEFSTRLANLIDAYVKSGTVTITPGIAVATTGPYAAAGVTTANGTGTIN